MVKRMKLKKIKKRNLMDKNRYQPTKKLFPRKNAVDWEDILKVKENDMIYDYLLNLEGEQNIFTDNKEGDLFYIEEYNILNNDIIEGMENEEVFNITCPLLKNESYIVDIEVKNGSVTRIVPVYKTKVAIPLKNYNACLVLDIGDPMDEFYCIG